MEMGETKTYLLWGLPVMFVGLEAHLAILMIAIKTYQNCSYTPSYNYLGGHLIETGLHMPQILQLDFYECQIGIKNHGD